MCGIFGYQWSSTNAHQIILHWLNKLEYRGYDSAGMMVGHDKEQITVKSVGKVSQLTNKVHQYLSEEKIYSYGIGHTRRATHGQVTLENTHPHIDSEWYFSLVHNGIIENYAKLKQQLQAKGYQFYSETDSEVIAKLLEDERTGNFLDTVEAVLPKLRGAYALLISTGHEPWSLIGVKLGSPLTLGKTKDWLYFSSDAQALAGVADQLLYLEDGELIYAKDWRYTIKAQGREIFKNLETFDEKDLVISKGDYKHFMLKEIEEQPNILKRILKGRVDIQDFTLHAEAFHGMQHEQYDRIVFVACGTSAHAAQLWALWVEQLAWIHCDVQIASEMQYRPLHITDKTLYVFVSQSGETADTLEVLKKIRNKGGKTFGIVNVVGSSISRLTDHGLFTRAGSEIGVASTKAFTAQALCLLLFALFLGERRELTSIKHETILKHIVQLPDLIQQVIENQKDIKLIAQQLSGYQNMFYVGRRYQAPIAYEGSLKLKETSYIHSQAYPTGELKHGALALIDEHTPTVFFHPQDMVFDHNSSSLQEIRARKGKVLEIGGTGEDADRHIPLPQTIDELYPLVTVVVAQLLSYHIADDLGKDIDKPRNLAKSVTVK